MSGINALVKYFEANWSRSPYPVIDHLLRIDRLDDGTFHFYIHPANTDGITTDFIASNEGVVERGFGGHVKRSGGIGWAIKEMQNGQKVARAGWNGKGMFLYYVPDHFEPGSYAAQTQSVHHQAYIAMKTAQDTVVPWLASQTDLLAIDWEVVS